MASGAPRPLIAGIDGRQHAAPPGSPCAGGMAPVSASRRTRQAATAHTILAQNMNMAAMYTIAPPTMAGDGISSDEDAQFRVEPGGPGAHVTMTSGTEQGAIDLSLTTRGECPAAAAFTPRPAWSGALTRIADTASVMVPATRNVPNVYEPTKTTVYHGMAGPMTAKRKARACTTVAAARIRHAEPARRRHSVAPWSGCVVCIISAASRRRSLGSVVNLKLLVRAPNSASASNHRIPRR